MQHANERVALLDLVQVADGAAPYKFFIVAARA